MTRIAQKPRGIFCECDRPGCQDCRPGSIACTWCAGTGYVQSGDIHYKRFLLCTRCGGSGDARDGTTKDTKSTK